MGQQSRATCTYTIHRHNVLKFWKYLYGVRLKCQSQTISLWKWHERNVCVYKFNLIWMNSIIILSKPKEYKISKKKAEKESRRRRRRKFIRIKWSNFRFFKSHVLCFRNFFFIQHWMFKMCSFFTQTHTHCVYYKH